MTAADKLRTFLRRLALPEGAFLALCAQSGHVARRLEDLPLPAGNDPLDVYYTVPGLAERLSVSEKTVRRRLHAGELGPPETVLRDGDLVRVPWSGILLYLRRHPLGPLDANAFRLAPTLAAADLDAGVAARSAGELKRKVEGQVQRDRRVPPAFVQTSGV